MNDDDSTINSKNCKQTLSCFILVLIIIIIIPAGLFLPQLIGLSLTWLIIAIAMIVILGITGLSLDKGWAGVLIDPKTNTMSLSRFQVLLWTWVILSAFFTLALARISDSRTHPDDYKCQPEVQGKEIKCNEALDIQIPPLLWALMGISITSAVGSPLLKAAKAQKTVGQDENSQQRAVKRGLRQEAAATYRAVLDERKEGDANLSEQVGETKPLGALVKKDSWQKAMFSDVFTGEEVATFGYVDIAKVQNLFFSVIAVLAYTVAIVSAMSVTENIAQFFAFPDISPGLVTIIGISHGGYLIDKGVTHSTPTEGKHPEI